MAVHDIVASFLGLGLIGIFSITLLEKFVPVVPSYVMLMLLGMTANSGGSLMLIMLATILGSLGGSLGWFAIGRLLGERRVEAAVARFGTYVFFRPAAYRRLAGSYRRNRFMVTMIGQTVPVARVYLGLPAGVLKLAAGTFVPAAVLGIALWNAPFLLLGFVLKGTSHAPAQIGVWMSLALIAAEIAILLIVRAVRRNRQPRVAAA